MTQQINLYQPILRRQRKVFSAGTIGVLLVGFLLLMALLWGVDRWQLEQQRENLSRMHAQERATTERIVDLTRKLGTRTEQPVLRKTVESMRREARLKRELLDRISGSDLGETAGFSGTLEGLGRQRLQGLWLTHIVLADGGREMRLRGNSQDAALVPRFIQQLGVEASFRGRGFRQLRMERSEHLRNTVEFQLATQVDDGKGEG